MLRGNHECSAINRVYGFFEECQKRYTQRLWQVYQDVFNMMPLVGLVGGKILCMHGGVSEKLTSLNVLRELERPIDPPNGSLHIDLLWADPDSYVKGYKVSEIGDCY